MSFSPSKYQQIVSSELSEQEYHHVHCNLVYPKSEHPAQVLTVVSSELTLLLYLTVHHLQSTNTITSSATWFSQKVSNSYKLISMKQVLPAFGRYSHLLTDSLGFVFAINGFWFIGKNVLMDLSMEFPREMI